MQITINDVRNAVQAALQAGFPGILVLDEDNLQAQTPPYFVMRLSEVVHQQELERRFMRQHAFVIHYYATNQSEAEMYDIAEQLTSVLYNIVVGDRQIRGTEMRVEVVDGVLHFNVNYSFHVWAAQTEVPTMENMKVQEGLK